jgi:hypothetical protein
MRQKSLHTLYSYWNQVRAGRLAPQRLDIEPSRIAGILSETFMLERADGGAYRFRLAGTRLCELFGAELRGKDFLDGWANDDRASVERLLKTISEQGAGATLAIEGFSDVRHRVEIEAMLLPLLHAGNKINRIIGVMSAVSTPHWLSNEPLHSRHLIRHQLIWPDGRPHAVVERSGGQAPFQPVPSAAMRVVATDRRRFRVVDGGRAGSKADKR